MVTSCGLCSYQLQLCKRNLSIISNFIILILLPFTNLLYKRSVSFSGSRFFSSASVFNSYWMNQVTAYDHLLSAAAAPGPPLADWPSSGLYFVFSFNSLLAACWPFLSTFPPGLMPLACQLCLSEFFQKEMKNQISSSQFSVSHLLRQFFTIIYSLNSSSSRFLPS